VRNYVLWLAVLIGGGWLSSSLYAAMIYWCCSSLGWGFLMQKTSLFLLLSLFVEIVLYGVSYLFTRLSRPVFYYGVFFVFLSGIASLTIVFSMDKKGMDAVAYMLYLFVTFQILCFSAGFARFLPFLKIRYSKWLGNAASVARSKR
jgi:hypothetical protein